VRRVYLGQDRAVAEEHDRPSALEYAAGAGLVTLGAATLIVAHFTYNVAVMVTASAVFERWFKKTKG
jgi:hypothetical protein